MRALLVALLAVALLMPAGLGLAPSKQGPEAQPQAVDPVSGLLVRLDPDGGRTLLLNVEDQPGGAYAYAPAKTPPQVPDVREAGAFVHAYARADGTPMLAVGTYMIQTGTPGYEGMLRIPLVLAEGYASQASLQATLTGLSGEAGQSEQQAAQYVTEILLPELADNFGTAPGASDFSTYHDYPPLYVWTVAKQGPAGAAWAGLYLTRTGSVTLDGAGRVASATKEWQVGPAARTADGTQRLPGAYLSTTSTAGTDGAAAVQEDRLEAGLTSATSAGTVHAPLAGAEFTDARQGGNLAATPRLQRSGASVGVFVQGQYTPFLGVQTTQEYRPSPRGFEVTRVTSVGPYVTGAMVPVAGLRYHSDTGEVQDVLTRAALNGPGSRAPGNFEVDVGHFLGGDYAPLAGLVYRTHFREARYAFPTFVAAGPYTPVGFEALVAASYDGNRPFLDWVRAYPAGNTSNDGWMVATGTTVAGTYAPVLGIEGRGSAPNGERAQQQEFRVGTFAASYRAFVPLASVSHDSDQHLGTAATGFAQGGTFGKDVGDADVNVGTYVNNAYVPLLGVQYRSSWDHTSAAESAVVVGAYGPAGFAPLVGVVYQGSASLQASLGNPTNTRDDKAFRFEAGIFAPNGAFVPLLTVFDGPDSAGATLGP